MAVTIVRKSPCVMQERDACPKCGGKAWYEMTELDIVQRCVCGLYRYVWAKTPDGGYRIHTQKKAEFKMPDKGTKLSTCLGHVAAQYPNTVTTRDLCGVSGQNTSDVSSQLIVLMHKGLIERVVARPGTKGGSIWKITRRALSKLSMEV
jgi:hypothetical protein